MNIKAAIFVVFALAVSAQAQDPWSQEKPEQREQAVINEDGGRSYLVRSGSAPLVGIVKPGQSGLGPVKQYSIFLGAGWGDSSMRARKDRLRSLLAQIRDQAQADEIARAGFNNFYGPAVSVEKLDLHGDRAISDLEIQSVVIEFAKTAAPDADAIYVVFLDPTLRSTLGSLVADKHYLAYHGFVSYAGAKIHYAVVPFQSDSQAAYQLALRTFVVAAMHTDEGSH